ncbi:hypothetical protein VTJ83DRAFT_2240 [Remersonia thermophila]|uniref:RNA polymerase II transcription factor B subunit 3 n=1 Tax=Remersonia thermophila TaxID=72144 RepID=A0ABR4DIE4_9PEZI
MSRKPGSTSASAGAPAISTEDMCPVCKTMRYLNKDMEFLINPECYHSMCVNCVNRLFNDGPNQCPYAGCHRTLRRKGFRSAFFGDLAVEREVDIRRRVAAVFNQVEDDFETLDDYNNYLQMVEDLTFDLVNGSDARRRQAEATLQQWEAEHRAEIERNRRAGRDADDAARRRIAAEREAARQRRVDALREAEQEKLDRARSREAELDSLASAGPDSASRVQLKRRGGQVAAQRALDAAVGAAEAASGGASGGGGAGGASGVGGASDVGRLSIRGLKEKKKPAASEGPYDPFGGLEFTPSRYRVLPGVHTHPGIEKYKSDPAHVTGGYDFDDYTARAMFEAFAGLAVFVEDEKEVGVGLSASEVTAISAGIAAVGDKMDLD